MKILTLCYEYPPVGGGESQAVFGLSRELASRGHEIHVVTMGFGDLPTHQVDGTLHVHRVPSIRRRKCHCTLFEAGLFVVRARSTIRRLLTERNFDLNHTHFLVPDGFNAAWVHDRWGLPYIVTGHCPRNRVLYKRT